MPVPRGSPKNTHQHPRHRFYRHPGTLSVHFVAGLVTLPGCATGGQDNRKSTAVGDDKSVGAVNLHSVLLVTSQEGEPAKLLGTLENNSGQSINVTISDDDEEQSFVASA